MKKLIIKVLKWRLKNLRLEENMYIDDAVWLRDNGGQLGYEIATDKAMELAFRTRDLENTIKKLENKWFPKEG